MLDQMDKASEPAVDARLPGDFNMWVFVLGDLLIFATYFLVFLAYRTQHEHAFLAAQHHLSVTTGAINTLVLLASSRFVALGVQAARAANAARASRLITYGGLCGLAFIAVKATEWGVEAAHGHTLAHDQFFMFYFMITGVHVLHVVLGLGILAIALRELRAVGAQRSWVVEAGATFWHMVDLLWVVIFALLYVVR